MGATVAVDADIDWALITTVAICCSSAVESTLEVCWMIDWVGMGELIPGTRNANYRLAHLIWLGISSINGNLTSFTTYFLVLLACMAVLTFSVSNLILLSSILIMVATG